MALSCIVVVLLTTFAAQWMSAACDDIVDVIPGAVISPNFPAEYPNYVDMSTCIQPSADFTLLTLLYFDTESNFDFLTIEDGNEALIWSDSGSIIPDIFPLSSNDGFIVSFTSDGSVTYPGFAVYYQPGSNACGETQVLQASVGGTITSPYYPGSYSNDQACSYVIVADEGYEVKLAFDNFELESNWDYLYVSNGVVTGALTGTPDERVLRDVLETTNIAFLTFTSDGSITSPGFSVTYSQISCHEDRSDVTPNAVVSPNFPGEYPNYVDTSICIQPSTEFTLLTVVFFDTEANYDYLTIEDSNGADFWSGSGSIIPDIFPLSSEFGFIVSFTSDGSVTYPGFAVYYQPGTSACGNTDMLHASDEGTITSPGFPGSYSDNQVCSWVIVADEGYEVNLSFDNFELESNWDYLYVSNGFVTEALTGTSLPSLPEARNMALLTFTSDGSVTRPGFSVTYSQTSE